MGIKDLIMRTSAIVAAAAVFAFGGQAVAADVPSASISAPSSRTGAVLVSHDGRYQPLLGTGIVRKGERVMVLKGGHASLTYADGCKVDLKVGSMTTIGDVSPCAKSGAGFRPVLAIQEQAAAAATGATASSTGVVSGIAAATGLSTTAVVVGGTLIAVAGTVGGLSASGAIDGGSKSP